MPTGREVNLNWRFESVLIRISGSHIASALWGGQYWQQAGFQPVF
jgi:hypothetical protein